MYIIQKETTEYINSQVILFRKFNSSDCFCVCVCVRAHARVYVCVDQGGVLRMHGGFGRVNLHQCLSGASCRCAGAREKSPSPETERKFIIHL